MNKCFSHRVACCQNSMLAAGLFVCVCMMDEGLSVNQYRQKGHDCGGLAASE